MQKREFLKKFVLGSGCCFLGNLNGSSLFGKENNMIDKFTHEAFFYTTTPRGAKCLLCPNNCELKEGEMGLCHNRMNINNKIYSLAYGNPCAVHVDPIEKKPLYHFYPASEAFSIGTAGCNMACLNCQNWEISQFSPREVKYYELKPDEVVGQCKQGKCKSIAYTYNEPLTFFEYAYDTAVLAKQASIKNVLVSNGFVEKDPLLKMCTVLDAANIDLKSFSDEIYIKLNGARLQPVLNNLLTLKNEDVWLEITNLVIPGWTDDFSMIAKMCEWLVKNGFSENPLHFSRFFPQYKLKDTPVTPVDTLIKARDIAFKSGMKYVYLGNVPGEESDNTHCPGCNELLVERVGYKTVVKVGFSGYCPKCKTLISGHWK
jgi:pyruvate formate lyase activating enzyme